MDSSSIEETWAWNWALWSSLHRSEHSSLCFVMAWRFAASWAPGWKCPSLLNRQELWALMMVTEWVLLSWWNKRPCSEFERTHPCVYEKWVTLVLAGGHGRAVKLLHIGQQLCIGVPLSFWAIVPGALHGATIFPINISGLSTVLLLNLFQVSPMLRDFLSASRLLVGLLLEFD